MPPLDDARPPDQVVEPEPPLAVDGIVGMTIEIGGICGSWAGPTFPQDLRREVRKAVSAGSAERTMAAEMAKVGGKRIEATN